MQEYDEDFILDLVNRKCVKDEHGCWLWSGSKTAKGYGQVGFRNGKQSRNHRVHVLVFSVLEGDIEGELHHKCGVRHCCNPDHLEDVPSYVNQRYSKGWTLTDGIWSCKRGHRIVGYNIKKTSNGGICCRDCANMAKRAFDAGLSLKN